jgi:hypothetical protein
MKAKKERLDNSTHGKLSRFDPLFLDEVQSFDAGQLKERLVLIAKNAEEIRDAKTSDTDLQSAKEQLKVMNETYSEPLKGTALKTKYIIELLASKGQ